MLPIDKESKITVGLATGLCSLVATIIVFFFLTIGDYATKADVEKRLSSIETKIDTIYQYIINGKVK